MYKFDPGDVAKHYQSNQGQYYVKAFGPSGKGLPFFSGSYTQRGQGLLGDLFRKFGIPLLKHIAPHAIKGISGLVRDVRKGRPVGKSTKKRVLKTAEAALSGKGRKRKRKSSKKSPPAKKKRKASKKKKATKKRKKTTKRKKHVTKAHKPFPLFS